MAMGLLDEDAILSCSVYVDLNPVQAGIAELPRARKRDREQENGTGSFTHQIALDPARQIGSDPIENQHFYRSMLFTAYRPPRFFPPPLHGISHDLVQLVGCFSRRTNRSHASGVRLRLWVIDLAAQHA
jgi:hypothetical protein